MTSGYETTLSATSVAGSPLLSVTLRICRCWERWALPCASLDIRSRSRPLHPLSGVGVASTRLVECCFSHAMLLRTSIRGARTYRANITGPLRTNDRLYVVKFCAIAITKQPPPLTPHS